MRGRGGDIGELRRKRTTMTGFRRWRDKRRMEQGIGDEVGHVEASESSDDHHSDDAGDNSPGSDSDGDAPDVPGSGSDGDGAESEDPTCCNGKKHCAMIRTAPGDNMHSYALSVLTRNVEQRVGDCEPRVFAERLCGRYNGTFDGSKSASRVLRVGRKSKGVGGEEDVDATAEVFEGQDGKPAVKPEYYELKRWTDAAFSFKKKDETLVTHFGHIVMVKKGIVVKPRTKKHEAVYGKWQQWNETVIL